MEKTKQEHFERVREFIRCSEYGHITTIDQKDFPRTRAMEDHNPYPGFIFWFATQSDSRKILEIQVKPHGSIYYDLAKHSEKGYINIIGNWEIRRDKESRTFLWREEWKAYWPEGPMAESYVPIKLTPIRIEYYNETDPTNGCLVIRPDEVQI